jgi:hypothetical protein
MRPQENTFAKENMRSPQPNLNHIFSFSSLSKDKFSLVSIEMAESKHGGQILDIQNHNVLRNLATERVFFIFTAPLILLEVEIAILEINAFEDCSTEIS